jgi:hypothetical protein
VREIGFVGLGGQKCASSWLYNVLREHPRILTSEKKELDYFSYHYINGLSWYLSQFETIKDGMFGDVSPSYLIDPESPKRCYAHNPDMKVIVVLRNPIERAYSNHLHEIRLGHIKNITFEEGLENNSMYVEQSLYGKHLEKWYAIFPATQIKVFFQEEINNNPKLITQQLYEFLNVERDFIPKATNKRENVSYVPKNRALDSLITTVAKRMKLLRMGFIIKLIKYSGVPLLIKKINRTKARAVVKPIRVETVQLLNELFSKDLSKLQKLINRVAFPWD